jgi:DNA-binding XRE family transcriptional regulator
MANPKFQFDERLLRPGQQEAAVLLIENAFATKKERRTKESIAEEVGISRKQLHRWENQDRNFIAYKNSLASYVRDSQYPLVISKLMDGINNGSMKGIELYFKMMGELNDKSEVTINDNRNDVSYEDRKAALLERLGTTDGKE